MAGWTVSQWVIIPLIGLGDLVVAVGIIGLLLYGLGRVVLPQRVPVDELRANTPKLPR